MWLAWLSLYSQSLPPIPTREFSPCGADSQLAGYGYFLGLHVFLHWTILWYWELLPPLQHPQDFTARGFEALVSHIGTLGCVVCLTVHLFLLVYMHTNVGPSFCKPEPGLHKSATAFWMSSPPQLPVSDTRTTLDEWFFNSLVVRFPCISIFGSSGFLFLF